MMLGVRYPGEIDCGAAARRFDLGPTFELGKSWTFDLEFNAPAEISTGQLFFIGDGRGGHDPLFVALAENRHLVVGVCDATTNEGGGYASPFTKDDVGEWKCVRVSYDSGSRAMVFEVDGKRVAEGVLTFTPTIDVAMPVWVGGVNADEQRFRGKVRRIRLRNTIASLGLP